MKIAIVAPSPVPFALGGAERLMVGLLGAINELTPHDAELIKLPSPERSLPDLIAGYRQFLDLDLRHFDVVISSKYPAWMVEHPGHVVYMMHPLRGLYDTYHSFGLPEQPAMDARWVLDLTTTLRRPRAKPDQLLDAVETAVGSRGADHPVFTFPGPIARLLIRALDAYALDPIRVVRHAAISQTVANRPDYFPPSVPVISVVPPSNLSGYRCEAFDHFFTASRLDQPKRLELLIEGMGCVPSGRKLRIAGSGPERERLEALAHGNPNIEFLGFVSDEQLLVEYANALAVPFVPRDEDLGYITLEAQLSGKPVITCTDSGGPTELVEDGVNGLIVPPTPEEIGRVLAIFDRDEERARTMGAEARSSARLVTWERVLAQIIPHRTSLRNASRPLIAEAKGPSGDGRRPDVASGRPSIVVVSTYPIFPSLHGGQIRCAHLFGALAADCDVELICLDGGGTDWADGIVRPGLRQTVVERSPQQRALEQSLAVAAGVPITDIGASLYALESPEFAEAVSVASRRAKLAILAHPYLEPVVREVAPLLPFIYDAHNAEYVLKDGVLPATPQGDELRTIVREVEARAVRGAVTISYCSAEDRDALDRLTPTLADWVHVPNGADVASLPFVTAPERQTRRREWLRRLRAIEPSIRSTRIAVFVGSYHPPNNEAAVKLLDFAPQFPHVLFVFIGNHCEYLRQWILPPNVLLAGVVPPHQLRELLAITDLALNPMLHGSGTNLKLIEAFAAGAPVVATPTGSRGIDYEGERTLVTAEIGDFPSAIGATLDDPKAAVRAVAARRLVERRYDWVVLGERLKAAVAGLLAVGRRQADPGTAVP